MIKRGAFSKTRAKVHLDKKRLLLASFVVISYSVSLYLFFLYCREIFRYLTKDEDNHRNMIVLSSAETYFYNFFFAGLAILTSLTYVADSFFMTQFRVRGYIKYSITNDFSGLQWYSVYILTKFGLFFWVLSRSADTNLAISLYQEFWFLFPLILIVLFLNQWVKIRYFFRGTFKPMVITASGFILLSGVLASIPFFDYKSFNHSVLKQTVDYNYSLDLPKSETSNGPMRMGLVADLYIAYPKTGRTDSAVTIVRDKLKPLSREVISQWISESKKQRDEFDLNQFSICLRIDKEVKMDFVMSLIDLIRENNIQKVYFMTTARKGMELMLLPHFREFTNDTIYWHPSLEEIAKNLSGVNILQIKLNENHIIVNDKSMSPDELNNDAKLFFENNKGNYVVDIETDNFSSYQIFIQTLDALQNATLSKKKEFAKKVFSKEYDSNIYDPLLQDTLSQLYPASFRLLNNKERAYLNRLSKK